MSVDLKLRYVVDGYRKTLSVAAPDGSWQPIATVVFSATREWPETEEAWIRLLGSAIEATAVAEV